LDPPPPGLAPVFEVPPPSLPFLPAPSLSPPAPGWALEASSLPQETTKLKAEPMTSAARTQKDRPAILRQVSQRC
jgi:hypothetical protein